MDVRLLLLALFFISACMPEAQVSRGNMRNSQSGPGSVPSGGVPVTNTSWNYLGSTTSNITISTNNLNTTYLIGAAIENYLGQSTGSTLINFTGAEYCVVSEYLVNNRRRQFRARAIPISYVDITQNRTVRIFRVDMHEETASAFTCAGTLYIDDGSGVMSSIEEAPEVTAFKPSALCTDCTSVLNSTNVRLFRKIAPGTLELTPSSLGVSGLSLNADPNESINNPGGSCTNSDCIYRGFNCCLDNQCVIDGRERPSAQTQFPELLAAARIELNSNALAYINYPQLFYVCGSSVPTTTGGGPVPSDKIPQMRLDFACINHIKSQASSMPFHLDVLTDPTPFTPITTQGSECLTTASTVEPSMYFRDVMRRLYQACGCAATTLQDMVQNCPAYEYSVLATSPQGQPIQFGCVAPPTSTPTVPTQQTVSVNSRSVPHRFFDQSGVEQVLLARSTHVQEGTPFSYFDDTKLMPNQTNFNMNAILGSMNVSLSEALPAKLVNVEHDQVYFIHTTTGMYTPCPDCGRDSWLASFSAHPSTTWGVGLQSIGHTTQRDFFSNNLTSGNYEDTIFGRACWVPPTMIPFTHVTNTNARFQRQDRLEAQAALFVNGYQKDWYGFNKGALIGSFDGVTWFAIGKGRIVRATSKKLFLAINAPFGDLANPSIHSVNIQAYDGITQAANVDYDPTFHFSHPQQNEAGTCQANHFCSTDTDCITRLGWEYACADVRDIKTQWPTFDSDGNELASVNTEGLEIHRILQQKSLPSSDVKRCVYRGAGAPCLTNSASVTSLNKRKALTCAPNFFCAPVNPTDGNQHFNSKIARYAANLEDIPTPRNHLFGKDANVLGRPLHYLVPAGATDAAALPARVRSSLIQNLRRSEDILGASGTGICRPGKALPQASAPNRYSPFEQHVAADVPGRRTDFISQIASCSSTLFTDYRYSSCPVIGKDGNYDMFKSEFLTGTSPLISSNHLKARAQNSCGLDSVRTTTPLSSTADAVQEGSPFKFIEAKPLHQQTTIQPTLVRDACLRRAGSVCHTDLDCGPNKLHADQVDQFNLSFFGNVAEREYYREYLVCGQEEPKPSVFNSEASRNYRMNRNTCCREIGKDITTYTANIPIIADHSAMDPASMNLNLSPKPGVTPNDPNRYSRFAVVQDLGTSSRPVLDAKTLSNDQWKTLSETNSKTCCGGGWIRKFADGGNDWGRRNRLVFDVTNFRCLNATTPLLANSNDVSTLYRSQADLQTLLNQDHGQYCQEIDGSRAGCGMFTIGDSLTSTGPNSIEFPYARTVINTVDPNFQDNPDFYFMPKSADSNSLVYMDYNADPAEDETARRNLSIKIPSYVSRAYFDNWLATLDPEAPIINLVSDDASDASISCIRQPTLPAATPSGVIPDPSLSCGSSCCYSYDSTTRILRVAGNSGLYSASGDEFYQNKVGVEIDFKTTGSGVGGYLENADEEPIIRSTPGSNSYYLSRLGRLELIGIPQINYEIIACNDVNARLVKGIFKPEYNYTTEVPSAPYINQHSLAHEPIFSPNEFKCCTPLGKTTTAASRCCSGYANAANANSPMTCQLPAGTNLMVYFNRFVSNEGRDPEGPGGGLVDADFSSATGEPKISSAVSDKIRALGTAYCQHRQVRQGGAFGSFFLEPTGQTTNQSVRIYGIVDSVRDHGQLSNGGQTVDVGYWPFIDGFRWNHHLYCDDGTTP